VKRRGARGIAGLASCLLLTGAWAAQGVPAQHAQSDYTYLSADLRALQDDAFANPGMLWVDRGRQLWSQAAGPNGQSCQSCHREADDAMRSAATRYPAWVPALGRVINLEQQINRCRVERLHAGAFPYESQELLALTAFLSYQAEGRPIRVRVDGPAAASFARGRTFFYQRRGQLNLSCANCHEQHAGSRLHGEIITQGQVNGFPIYRELWQTMGSTHRMFAWCNEAVRAEPYPPGAQEYVDLELFERWRGRGLSIETPAVRR
jgi:sulfur-oxidizing protein SoxA